MTRHILLPFLLSILLCSVQFVSAQEKWDLRRCVEFALGNNINIKQADVQAKISALTFDQSKLQQWPTLNFQNSTGTQFGRSIDPATNGFTNDQIYFSQFGLQTGVTLFNWFSIKNQIAANELETKAQVAGVEKLKNDISLNVAAAYLQVLLSREQVNITKVQINQTTEQLANTRKLVDAGSLPELNAAELDAQLARDSNNYIGAFTTYQTNLLSLKVWMNYDPAQPLDLETPPVERIPIESFADSEPDMVYQLAIKNLPQQRINQLRLESLLKFQQVAKAGMYPTISAFGNANTSYSSALKNLPKGTQVIPVPIGFVTVPASGTTYNVFQNVTIPTSFDKANFLRQLDFQFRQSLGVGINIPIFNNGTAKINWKRSKLSVQNQQLQLEKDNQTLKQDIYNAYNSALAAYQRFQSSIKSVQTAEYSYELTRKRYDAGLLRTIDLITNQNNLFRARLEKISNQFDFVFRMKVLEFYKGQGIKL